MEVYFATSEKAILESIVLAYEKTIPEAKITN